MLQINRFINPTLFRNLDFIKQIDKSIMLIWEIFLAPFNTWRILKNRELWERYKDSDINALSIGRKIRWVEHVLGRGNNSLVFQAMKSTSRGRRPLNRLRWKDQVYNDVLLISGYHRNAEDTSRQLSWMWLKTSLVLKCHKSYYYYYYYYYYYNRHFV